MIVVLKYFKLQELGVGVCKGLFIDVVVGFNNLVNYFLKEVLDEFGFCCCFRCLISIGMGMKLIEIVRVKIGFKNYMKVWGQF